ncbi:MAG: sugar phosphate nucleotidyltransferase, partial [Candidatus Thermoplasmatota archaeon]|nr:sugar phosphate nucleotidyltransferase [Candidatus Thermoplasmatota archaeon]
STNPDSSGELSSLPNRKDDIPPGVRRGMRAVILTAGEAARLRGWTTNRPKGMLPLANRTILEHLVEGLRQAGVRQVTMVVGHGAEGVMSLFGDGRRYDVAITYTRQEKLTGTVDALRLGAATAQDKELRVVPGDNFVAPQGFAALLEQDGEALLASEALRWSKWGGLELEGDAVHINYEAPEAIGRLHFTGIARLAPKTIAALTGAKVRHLGQALQALLASGAMPPAVAMADAWHNIVYPWDLVGGNQIALRYLQQELAGTCEAGVTIRGAVTVGNGTRVAAGCYLQGPLSIGSGCRIGPGSVLGPSTTIGDGVEIGTHCEITDTLIMDSTTIDSFTHLQACVIGEGSYLGAHVVALPGPEEATYLQSQHSVIDRGAMVGDGCHIGDRAVLQGGCVLWRNASVDDGETVNGEFPARDN